MGRFGVILTDRLALAYSRDGQVVRPIDDAVGMVMMTLRGEATSADGDRGVALLLPDGRPARGMLVTLAGSRADALTAWPHRIAADHALAEGLAVMSLDLPCHGDWCDGGAGGIDGLAQHVAQGDDPFAAWSDWALARIGRAREMLPPGPLVLCGVSRGAYAALRLTLREPSIDAVAALAPVIDWRVLREFEAIREQPAAAALDLVPQAAALAGRAVFLAIGAADRRVGTERCLAFAAALWQAEAAHGLAHSAARLHVVEGHDHALPDGWRHAGARFLTGHIGAGGAA